MKCLKSKNVTLHPYQKNVVQFLIQNRGLLALFSTGSGKTLTAAAAAACLLKHKIVENVVVLLKKTAIGQFKDEVKRFWPEAPIGKSPKENMFLFDTHFIFFRGSSRDSRPNPATTFLVVDEVHEFSNSNAKSSGKVIRYASACKRVLLLTATAFVNEYYDIAPLMAMIKSEPLINRKAFESLFQNRNAFKNWLKNTTSVHLIDKSKDQNYPKVFEKDIRIPMSEDTWKEYRKREKKEGKKTFYISLRQLSMGFNSCEKCHWIERYVTEWIRKGEGKIVIYTSFLDKGVEVMKQSLRRIGANFEVIDGSTTAAHRRAVVTKYNTPPLTEKQLAQKKRLHQNMGTLVKKSLQRSSGTSKRALCGKQLWFKRHTISKPTKDKVGVYKYYDKRGKVIRPTAGMLEYLGNSTPIPPAWSPAVVCERNQKLLWAAKDKKGRWQRRYTEDWNNQQEFKKILRLKRLTTSFWDHFFSKLRRNLSISRHTPTWTASLAVALIAHCHFRPGWSSINKNSKSLDQEPHHYGLISLQSRHIIRVTNSELSIHFTGKSGKGNTCTIQNSSSDLIAKELYNGLKFLKNKTKNGRSLLFSNISEGDLRKALESYKITAKDFRTYFANFSLIQMIRDYKQETELFGGRRPDEVNLYTRRRMLTKAYQAISKGLNNTPAVTKSSYIFTGFWVLYLVDPVLFMEILDDADEKKKTTEDVMSELIEMFETDKIDWRVLLEELNNTGPSAKPVDVLLITEAGAESMDLKGTRHIILADPVWTSAMEEQIIGRGQRWHSHIHLPPSEQNVHVWKLLLCRPGKETAELTVRRISLGKKKEVSILNNLLQSVSM